jgi:hypothetical protein
MVSFTFHIHQEILAGVAVQTNWMFEAQKHVPGRPGESPIIPVPFFWSQTCDFIPKNDDLWLLYYYGFC